MDGADEGVSGEGAIGDELDLEGETILVSEGLVDRELHRKIPGGVCASVSVDGRLGLLGVAGERNDGVDVHLGEEVDIFDVFC